MFRSANTFTQILNDNKFYKCGENGYCLNGIGIESLIDSNASVCYKGYYNSNKQKKFHS